MKLINEFKFYIQITLAIVANITILSCGVGIGFPAITLPSLTNKTDPMGLTDDEFSWFASITSITCPLGGLFSGYSLEQFGRKRSLILTNIIGLASWLILIASSTTNKERMFIELLLSRLISGFSNGLSTSAAAVYSAEISHKKLRGRLTILTSLSVALGVLVIYTLGYFISNFRLLSLICGILTFASLVSLIPLPESPTWLVARGKLRDAEKTLRIVRGVKKGEPTTTKINDEIIGLVHNLSKSQSFEKKETILQILKRPEVYKPLRIMTAFVTFQQFSGIFVIIIYGAQVALELGVSMDARLITVYIGVTRVVTSLAVAYISDKWGRKPSAFISAIGMALSLFGMSAHIWNRGDSTETTWVPGALLLSYILFASFGLLTLPFSMMAELFPQKFRGFGSGLTIFTLFSMSFIVVKLYPTMITTMGNRYVYIFYGIICLFAAIFIFIFLPETKGKTLQEIEDNFRGEYKHSINNEGLEKMI